MLYGEPTHHTAPGTHTYLAPTAREAIDLALDAAGAEFAKLTAALEARHAAAVAADLI
jgi:hypothetical protein